MKSPIFPTTTLIMAFFLLPACVYAQDNVLIEPPLTWSVNSIQIVWTVSQGVTTTQETRFIYGADENSNQRFGKEIDTEKESNAGFAGSAGLKFNANAALESNPLTFFGLKGTKVNASAYLEGGVNYNYNNKSTNSTQWTESEKSSVSKALNSAFENHAQQTISNQRLVFTVDFINHTRSRLFFSSNAANTIPVYCGNVHLGDAHLVNRNASIAATGQPIPCQFEMALNDTGKQKLISARPVIRIEGGQLLIQSDSGADVRDAIEESTVATSYFTVSVLSGNEVKEWKIRCRPTSPVTLLKALEAINENLREKTNNDSKTIFTITDKRLISVCGAPFKDSGNSNWTAELIVFNGALAQTVNSPDSYLLQTPHRGECYIFRLVNQEFKNLTRQAESGNAAAQNVLGLCYKYGKGVPEDKSEAVKWLRKSAQQGFEKAQYNLGLCYMNGDGVPIDMEEAAKWQLLAAQKGVANAQFNLGLCYYYGDGVAENKPEAVKWWLKAAQQGHADAQCYLGACYYFGEGVECDYSQASKWLSKSAQQGNEEAAKLLKRLDRSSY